VTALRAAATSLGSGIRAARENPIPSCLSGAHRAEVTGLADLSRAVTGFDNALGAVGSNDYPAARQDMQTAIAALQPGAAEMAKATADGNRPGTP
jgi:hypothetical protein